MSFLRTNLFSLAIASCLSLSAHAAPILINYSDIVPTTTEDFEDETLGTIATPAAFEGFAFFQDGQPSIGVCGFMPRTQCLTGPISASSASDPQSVFTLSNATAFGFEVFPTSGEIFSVEVVGNSGSASFVISDIGFFGFSDPLGLLSITVINTTPLPAPRDPSNRRPNPGVSGSRIAFDNVITDAAVVPVPAAAPLFLAGAGVIAMLRRRRRAKQ